MLKNNIKGLHLFCNPYSNCSARVMLAVAEKQVDAKIHIIDLLKGEQLTLDYYNINPTCDVPAIVHNGKAMGDSITILRYLEDAYPETSLIPKSLEQRLKMEEFISMASDSHMAYVVPWIYAKGFGRLPTEEQRAFYDKYVPHRSDFHKARLNGKIGVNIKLHEEQLHSSFNILEPKLSQTQYLAGNSYSLADIAWFPTCYLLGRIFDFPLKKYPYTLRWMDKIENRPAFQRGVKSYMKPIPYWLLRLVMKLIRLTGGRK